MSGQVMIDGSLTHSSKWDLHMIVKRSFKYIVGYLNIIIYRLSCAPQQHSWFSIFMGFNNIMKRVSTYSSLLANQQLEMQCIGWPIGHPCPRCVCEKVSLQFADGTLRPFRWMVVQWKFLQTMRNWKICRHSKCGHSCYYEIATTAREVSGHLFQETTTPVPLTPPQTGRSQLVFI